VSPIQKVKHRTNADEVNIISQGVADKVRVCVRIRPPLRKEFACEEVVSTDNHEGDNTQISIKREMERIESHYDQVYSKDSSQEEIFEFTRPAISGVIDGFN